MINYQSFINQATFKSDMSNPKISRLRVSLSKEKNTRKVVTLGSDRLREW